MSIIVFGPQFLCTALHSDQGEEGEKSMAVIRLARTLYVVQNADVPSEGNECIGELRLCTCGTLNLFSGNKLCYGVCVHWFPLLNTFNFSRSNIPATNV